MTCKPLRKETGMDMDQDRSEDMNLEFGCGPALMCSCVLSLAMWYGIYCLVSFTCHG